MRKILFLALMALAIVACNKKIKPSHDKHNLPKEHLSSWKNKDTMSGAVFSINTVIDYVEAATDSTSKPYIATKDRIAVFDMDGTIACERPFSMELFTAYKLAFGLSPSCNDKQNDLQKAVLDAFGSYLPGTLTSDSLVSLITMYTNTIENNCIPKHKPKNRVLKNQFYKPMIELIEYLQANDFQVYIVSGSSQQFIWGIVKNEPTLAKLPPSHIIGSLQKYKSITHLKGKGPEFYLDTANFFSNVSSHKAINIYNRIGKKPVLAFGNTVNDFDMFSLTSSNKEYPTLCVLINHDSDKLEEKYNAFDSSKKVCKNWNQEPYCNENWNHKIFTEIMTEQGWHLANMSECFNHEAVFINN
ncbi:MAG: haloacid dehalogenase-like hydrolase [Salinivirgaceae bacterium]|nr:haloacid dehalogenase-like hydrolase [Salinivirgaceae bacterium]